MPAQDGFTDACREGDIAAMKLHLRLGADPNAPLPGGMVPMALAVRRGPRAVELLIRHGADPNKRFGKTDRVALHWADTSETTTMLIRAGANPNLRDSDGYTPLHTASIHTASALLAGGADPDCVTGDGTTPLGTVVYYDNAELVRELLHHGADPNLRGRVIGPGMVHPLATCVRMGRADIAEALLDAGADLRRAWSDPAGPLVDAIAGKNTAVMKLLIARGASTYVLWALLHDPVVQKLRRVCLADAGTLCRATHDRLGADSPASLLRGFPGIAAFIVDRANPVPGHKPAELP